MHRKDDIEELRRAIDELNDELLEKLNERASLVQTIGQLKKRQGIEHFDPLREKHMIDRMISKNRGPFTDETIKHLFKEILKAGLELQEDEHREQLLVSRKQKPENTVVKIKGTRIGDGSRHLIAGPCAVESFEQTAGVAQEVKKYGLEILRGGAFKPRTSPYDFQGLGLEGLKILKQVGDMYDLAVVSEIVNPADIEMACEYLDVIQIGARNMQNFELLKAAGETDKPVFLKRGMAATLDEFMKAAEYIISRGNDQIILCERGIRTYEKATRNTLDISAVPILKQETHLPVFVDVTHSTGRRDLLIPTAKAALAIGADGVMAEVHPEPAVALSDSAQQMDFELFSQFVNETMPFGIKSKIEN